MNNHLRFLMLLLSIALYPTIGLSMSLIKLSESVVSIATPSSFGSGFYVSEHLVLTNAHVCSDYKKVDVEDVISNVIKTNSLTDLCLIKTKRKGIPVTLGDMPKPLDEVTIISGRLILDVSKGYVTKTSTTYGYYVSAQIDNGMSGSPVFSTEGKVTGIVSTTRRLVKYHMHAGIISINIIKGFIKGSK